MTTSRAAKFGFAKETGEAHARRVLFNLWLALTLALSCGCRNTRNGFVVSGNRPLGNRPVHKFDYRPLNTGDLAQGEQRAEIQTVAFSEHRNDVSDDFESDRDGDSNDRKSIRSMLAEDSGTTTEPAGTIQLATPIIEESLPAKVPRAEITLDSMEQVALSSHPAIREQLSKVDASRGQFIQAGLPFNPVFQYQSEEVGNENSSGLHTAVLSQQIVTANKLGIAKQVQAREIQKQLAHLRITELKVLARLRSSFALALIAQRRQEIAEQIVRLSEEATESVEKLFNADEVSQVALLQARVEMQQARIAAENAATQYRAKLNALAAAAGTTILPLVSLAGDLDDELIERPWDSLIDEITAISPEMSLAGSELERAKWALQLACAQVIPNVTVQAGTGYDGFTNDTFGTFGISVPLPIRNRNQGNIRTAQAEIKAASAAIERTQLDLQGKLADVAGRYEVARQRYVRLTDTVVPDAQETYRLARQAFDAGETDFLQLLTAQRTLFDIQLTVLGAIETARQSAAEIDSLLVRLQF